MSKKDILNKVKHSGLVPMPVYGHTYDMAAKVLADGIEGDMVECGVYAGAQVGVMAQAIVDAGEARRVHAFDSFEGIPEAGPKDDCQPGIGDLPEHLRTGRLVSSGVSSCSEQAVRANLDKWGVPENLVVFHKGWFQHTVIDWGGAISLLRLDGDLYESTLVCLKFLYPFLSKGGICIVDDCNLGGCHRAISDYFQGEPPARTVVEEGDGCEWWIKGQPA